MVRQRLTSHCGPSGQDEGSPWGHPHGLVPPKGLVSSRRDTRDSGIPRGAGRTHSSQHGGAGMLVCRRERAAGQAGATWQRSVKMFRAPCALCGAACGPGGLLTPAESQRDPCCLCACQGSARPGGPAGGRRADAWDPTRSLLSACGARGGRVREPPPPARLP